jgi:hypothetical protein
VQEFAQWEILVGVDAQCANTPPSHDFIEFSVKTPERISEDYSKLYASGLSLNDISEQSGIARSTFRDAFKKHQIPIRTKRQTIKGENFAKASSALATHHSATATLLES